MGSAYGASYFVILATLVFDIIAFGLAIGAESRRNHVTIETDVSDSYTTCRYSKDIATGLGIGAFLFLLLGQLIITGVTRCLCCSSPLRPGGSRVAAVVFFILSWFTFVVAELCLLAGSTRAAYRTRSRGYQGAFDLDCKTLRKGVFSAGAAFTFFTLLLSEGYYLCFVKSQENAWQTYNTGGGPGVGMTPYPRPY
ncbi:hypothetical protein SELMODRAFT_266989 [Selaginella moellendorffii]|uniref:Fiber protein Fb34 n=2 Tax=Selaginella moellendorffii TaxID=88036 RepID=D8R5L1_SELML|nr:uncharacterized protein LOC9652266 [Selaginella moellendorffii]EFJ16815.1 hypothetical protein SELMODRAFT_154926 [Selaginella moellendorffii]EFJ32171.1 hypothetical protein SELMODRAFT_266989 [Selaginella moellendorffii]|eukprot:XP_002966144.1 uncharacterized protein LOC9652266 [Selaginella moellendorffii]